MELVLKHLHHNNIQLDMGKLCNQYLVCVHQLVLNKHNQGHKDLQSYLPDKTQLRDKRYILKNLLFQFKNYLNNNHLDMFLHMDKLNLNLIHKLCKLDRLQ